jgi:hypothetical protein
MWLGWGWGGGGGRANRVPVVQLRLGFLFEDNCLLECDAVQSGIYIQTFQIFLGRSRRQLKDIGSLKYKLYTKIVRLGVRCD